MHRALMLVGCLWALVARPTRTNSWIRPAGCSADPAETPPLPGIESTPERIELGKMLYFEPRLSESHAIAFLSHCRHGWGRRAGERRSGTGGGAVPCAPTVLNAVFNTAQFWDSRAKGPRGAGGRAAGQSDRDGNERAARGRAAERHSEHVEKFRRRSRAGRPITFTNVPGRHCLVRGNMITPNAPFDGYLRGDARCALRRSKQGLQLFVDNGCAACHSGINVGVEYQPWRGRAARRRVPAAGRQGSVRGHQVGERRVCVQSPDLRNIELTPPYFHTGKSWDLRQAVAVMGASQLGIELTDEEVDKITGVPGFAHRRAARGDIPVLPPSVATTRIRGRSLSVKRRSS